MMTAPGRATVSEKCPGRRGRLRIGSCSNSPWHPATARNAGRARPCRELYEIKQQIAADLMW